MTLSNQRATLGLSADAWPVSTAVGGPVPLGRAAFPLLLTLATTAYTVLFGTITAAKTGTCRQNRSNHSDRRRHGDRRRRFDFEGVAIPRSARSRHHGPPHRRHRRRRDPDRGSSSTVLRVPAPCRSSGIDIRPWFHLLGHTFTVAATATPTVEITVFGKV